MTEELRHHTALGWWVILFRSWYSLSRHHGDGRLLSLRRSIRFACNVRRGVRRGSQKGAPHSALPPVDPRNVQYATADQRRRALRDLGFEDANYEFAARKTKEAP
jgi:hypothetical protein